MTDTRLLQAQARILAAALRGIPPQAVIKGADQVLASNTTLQNDTALYVPLEPGASYIFVCYLDFEGASGAGLKWAFTLPATGATMRAAALYLNTSGTLILPSSVTEASLFTAETIGAGTTMAALMVGSVVTVTGATVYATEDVGNMQLQWAQNSSNVTNTIVHAQSFLSLWQISGGVTVSASPSPF